MGEITESMRQPIQEGGRLGRYQLITRLATGGMAEVWLGRATGVKGFQKTIVLKTILPHLADDPDFLRMFVDEALLAAALNHPNIVQIFDLGQIGDTYFIAMEFILGKTMRQVQRVLRKQRKVMPPWLVLRTVVSVCDALHYAHNRSDDDGNLLGIVHRDVTPENLMVSFSGVTKVVDFGIAKASTAATVTRAGKIKGKLSYLAPEQIIHAGTMPPDGRSDIYSLGVVLYELLTGVRPFRASNDMALLLKIPKESPQPPCDIARWVPTRLSDIVMKAMAKDPDERFLDAGALGEELETFLTSVGTYPTERHISGYMCKLFTEDERRIPTIDPKDTGKHVPMSARSLESATGVELDGPDSAGSFSIEISVNDALITPSIEIPHVTIDGLKERSGQKPPPLPNRMVPKMTGDRPSQEIQVVLEPDDFASEVPRSKTSGSHPSPLVAPGTAPSLPSLDGLEAEASSSTSQPIRFDNPIQPPKSGVDLAALEVNTLALSQPDPREPMPERPGSFGLTDDPTPLLTEPETQPQASPINVVEDTLSLPVQASTVELPEPSVMEKATDLSDLSIDAGHLEAPEIEATPISAVHVAPSPPSSSVNAFDTPKRIKAGGVRATLWDTLVQRAQEESEPSREAEAEAPSARAILDEESSTQDLKSDTSATHAWDLLVQRAVQAEEDALAEAEGLVEAEAPPGKDASEENKGRSPSSSGWDAYIQRLQDVQPPEPVAQSPEPPTDEPAWTKHEPSGKVFGRWQRLTDAEAEAATRFDEGLALIREGRKQEALEAWERAVQLAPDNRRYSGNLRLLRKATGEETSS
jgi:serine/threonine protein kinase